MFSQPGAKSYPKVPDAKSQASQSEVIWVKLSGQDRVGGADTGLVGLPKQKTLLGYDVAVTWTRPLVVGLSYGMSVLEAGQ